MLTLQEDIPVSPGHKPDKQAGGGSLNVGGLKDLLRKMAKLS